MAARIEERRAEPRDDLLSDLVHATLPDGPDGGPRGLTVPELLNVIEQLLVAGNETTTKAIAAGLHLLMEHSSEYGKVLTNHGLIPNLVEEVLRVESPVQMLFRVATADVTVGGVEVPAGATLVVMYGCANRDEQHFPDGDVFDIERGNARSHLAFGQGPHFCVGAPLARVEARIAFEVLLGRLHGITLSQDHHPPHDRELSMVLRGLSHLHLAFRPGPKVGAP
jgi:cytochrome P450